MTILQRRKCKFRKSLSRFAGSFLSNALTWLAIGNHTYPSFGALLACAFLVAASSTLSAAVIVVGSSSNNLVKFDMAGNHINTIPLTVGSGTPFDIAEAPNGDVFVSRSDGTVIRFDSDLNFISSWNSGADGGYGINVDASGLLHVIDWNDAVLVFDAGGVFQTSLTPTGGANIRDVAFVGNETWVTNFTGNKIDVFDSAGNDVGDILGQTAPFGIETDPRGDGAWVIEQNSHVLRQLDSSGNTLFSFDADDGPFGMMGSQVRHFGIDNSGNLYVADSFGTRVDVYNSTGTFLSSISHPDLSRPHGVLVTSTSSIPEPSSLAILGIGSIVFAGYRWRRPRSKHSRIGMIFPSRDF